MTEKTSSTSKPEILGTLKDDLRRGNFGQTIHRDFRELKEYMLEEERKKRLSEMRQPGRWFVLMWWLVRSLFFKLTPARRLLLVSGMVLIMISRTSFYSSESLNVSIDVHGIGIVAILFVLMLELKDKLVAHDELKAGRVVQQALMPERKPHVPGWELWLFTRSANEVGGDLVDFMKIGENRIGIAIGDVAGKGLSAALLTAKLQATLRALVADFTSLARLGSKLNQIFCRDSLRNIFASLVYIELAPNSGSVRLVNAGHIPPVIVKAGRIEKMAKGGVALGIMPEGTFDEQLVQMESGNMLLIYSDGLTEAQSSAGEFFGEQRLLGLLPQLAGVSAEQAGERLVAEVERFVGEERAHDDLSIVVIRRS
jgi:serine phosphatase RsbU (regulator of sigma subunit)